MLTWKRNGGIFLLPCTPKNASYAIRFIYYGWGILKIGKKMNPVSILEGVFWKISCLDIEGAKDIEKLIIATIMFIINWYFYILYMLYCRGMKNQLVYVDKINRCLSLFNMDVLPFLSFPIVLRFIIIEILKNDIRLGWI